MPVTDAGRAEAGRAGLDWTRQALWDQIRRLDFEKTKLAQVRGAAGYFNKTQLEFHSPDILKHNGWREKYSVILYWKKKKNSSFLLWSPVILFQLCKCNRWISLKWLKNNKGSKHVSNKSVKI